MNKFVLILYTALLPRLQNKLEKHPPFIYYVQQNFADYFEEAFDRNEIFNVSSRLLWC